MSIFELESPKHDIFVSLAIEAFMNKFGGVLIYADGRLPLKNHVTAPCPVFNGYRPDAVTACRLNQLWFIEVKSYDDLNSGHTNKQFEIIATMMAENENLYLYLFVFDADDRNVFFPRVFDLVRNRVVVVYPEG